MNNIVSFRLFLHRCTGGERDVEEPYLRRYTPGCNQTWLGTSKVQYNNNDYDDYVIYQIACCLPNGRYLACLTIYNFWFRSFLLHAFISLTLEQWHGCVTSYALRNSFKMSNKLQFVYYLYTVELLIDIPYLLFLRRIL